MPGGSGRKVRPSGVRRSAGFVGRAAAGGSRARGAVGLGERFRRGRRAVGCRPRWQVRRCRAGLKAVAESFEPRKSQEIYWVRLLTEPLCCVIVDVTYGTIGGGDGGPRAGACATGGPPANEHGGAPKTADVSRAASPPLARGRPAEIREGGAAVAPETGSAGSRPSGCAGSRCPLWTVRGRFHAIVDGSGNVAAVLLAGSAGRRGNGVRDRVAVDHQQWHRKQWHVEQGHISRHAPAGAHQGHIRRWGR